MRTLGWGLAGLLAKVGYVLSRYRLLSVPLDRLLLAILAALPPYLAWRGGLSPADGAIAAVCLPVFASLLWLRARSYLLFRPEPLGAIHEERPLAPDEKVQLRGAGRFEVSGMKRDLIGLPALIWITELEEYILMARLQVHRLPLVQAPTEEEGMWYAFFKPEDITSIVSGRLWFGLARWPAIELRYRSADSTEAKAYLSCHKPEEQRRLMADLLKRARRQG